MVAGIASFSIVDAQGRVVTGGRVVVGPVAGDDDILVALRGEVSEPVGVVGDAVEPAGACMLGLLLTRDVHLSGLRSAQVAGAPIERVTRAKGRRGMPAANVGSGAATSGVRVDEERITAPTSVAVRVATTGMRGRGCESLRHVSP